MLQDKPCVQFCFVWLLAIGHALPFCLMHADYYALMNLNF